VCFASGIIIIIIIIIAMMTIWQKLNCSKRTFTSNFSLCSFSTSRRCYVFWSQQYSWYYSSLYSRAYAWLLGFVAVS